MSAAKGEMRRRVLAAGMRKERRCFSARGSGGDDVVIGILTAGCAEETADLKRARPDLEHGLGSVAGLVKAAGCGALELKNCFAQSVICEILQVQHFC